MASEAAGTCREPAVASTEWYDWLRQRSTPSLRRALADAHSVGEYVGQQGFTTASEILALAQAAGITAKSLVLDLCCGSGGCALYLARELGCRILGVDLSFQGARLARSAAEDQGLLGRAAFVVADAHRLPVVGGFDGALLLETALAFGDKGQLLREVNRVLRPGGALGLTVEVGAQLLSEERARLPGGERVWLVPEGEFLALLVGAGFGIRRVEDHTAGHAAVARRLAVKLGRHGDAIAGELGAELHDELTLAHTRWAEWLSNGRVRKLAVVAERLA